MAEYYIKAVKGGRWRGKSFEAEDIEIRIPSMNKEEAEIMAQLVTSDPRFSLVLVERAKKRKSRVKKAIDAITGSGD